LSTREQTINKGMKEEVFVNIIGYKAARKKQASMVFTIPISDEVNCKWEKFN